MRFSTLIGWVTLGIVTIAVIASFGLPALPVHAATRTYSGTVTINGNPAPPGTVIRVFISGQTAPCASTTTGVGGSYSIAVNDTGGPCPPTGSTTTALFFHVVGPFGARRVAADTFTGPATPTLNLEYNWHQISGTVSVGSTPPPAGAAVEAFVDAHPDACVQADTVSSGAFSLVVVRGAVGTGNDQPPQCHDGIAASPISFHVNGTPVLAVTVNFSPGANTTGLILALPEAGHRVSGLATIGGNPAAGTQVQALIGSTVCATTMTNDSGQFDFNVPPTTQTAGCGVNGATINFRVAGQPVATTLTFQSGGVSTNVLLGLAVTPTPTPTPTITPTATPTLTPTPTLTLTPTPTPTARPAQWLDRPPTTAGAVQTCPTLGQWLLLYWGGDTPIATAAAACPNADRFWVSRQGQWFGFAPGAPGASDTWDVVHGEAHFVRGG